MIANTRYEIHETNMKLTFQPLQINPNALCEGKSIDYSMSCCVSVICTVNIEENNQKQN